MHRFRLTELVLKNQDFRTIIARTLPVFGHRNWIVVADAAYPEQSRRAVETIATNSDPLVALQYLFETIDRMPHVRAIAHLDSELELVGESDASGVAAYRHQLAILLESRPVVRLPHDQLIQKLDEAARTFRVLVLKTNLLLPYTSVFVQLDCGYWTTDAERRLRAAALAR